VDEDVAICRSLGDAGAELVPDGARILTHCNAGALATAGWGTALGVVRSAVAAGRRVEVLAGDLVIVGADRVARNGDVANKIGTYTVALLAREHAVPFYVAAPLSSIDLDTPDGGAIPIEEREPAEVTHIAGQLVMPEGVPVRHPAFDVTPAALVSAIVTERGIVRPPYASSLQVLFDAA
jgi:methylthioribose-1-phosphate isomerase